MYPELFKIGPLTVYSYGLMLGISFIVGSYFLNRQIERKKLDPNIATETTLLAIVFGVAGGKLFHLLEHWKQFIADPIGMAFSPGGLTFYGGLFLAILAIYIYVRRKKIPFLVLADAAAPSLALSYGIGRIGCHLAGDGDYGIPTDLPWGIDYSNGTVPPSAIFNSPEMAKQFPSVLDNFPNGVPDTAPLHPTPIYEFIVGVIIFYLLWKLSKKDWMDGKLFMLYLILSGTSRLMVEFIRLNPRIMFGLSEAQLISAGLIVIGIAGWFHFAYHKELVKFVPPPLKPKEVKK